MKYIVNTLGIEAITEPWHGENILPYYLIDYYDFKKVMLDGVACLFMKPKSEPESLKRIKKHIEIVHKVEPLPIVLELGSLTARRRKSLIESRIPFVSPECQIYLPFLGIALNERFTSVKEYGETLMPSSQLLFFYFLYNDTSELQTAETASVFGLSAMQISRATKQLNALGLVSVKKDGVRIIISNFENRSDLFDRAKPYLLNPVRKKIYVNYEELPELLPLSGYSALSELTMLGESQTKTFAFQGKEEELTGTNTLVDNDEQAEVELWRYDPTLLSKHPGLADPLSVIASLPDVDDPRIEQSVIDLLTELWR